MTREPTFESYEALMRHEVPKASRRKMRRPWSLKPPRCPVCNKWLSPDFDHGPCGIGKPLPRPSDLPDRREAMSEAHPEDHEHPALTPDLPEDVPTFVSQHEEEL